MMSGSRRLRLRTGAAAYRVDVPPDGPLTVEGAAAPVDVIRRSRTTLQAVVDGRRIPVWIADAGDRCLVFADGCTFTLELDPDVGGPSRTGPPVDHAQDAALAAPMPATVVATRAEPGQAVRAGDVLVVLEAMKMELTIRAPRDGIVDAVHCRQGDLVQPGVPLVTMQAPRGA